MSNARNLANLLNTSGEIESNKLDDNAVHGRRNLVINGAMQVAQRGTSFTDASGEYMLDRYRINKTNIDNLVVDVTQDTDTPDGFSSSMKFDVTTAESAIASDERCSFEQRIEAQNLQHLQYGTSGAKTLTLSFWVKSSVTGKYGINIRHHDANVNKGLDYTINTADTWEYKQISFTGYTPTAINNDNGIGLWLRWMLIVGTDYQNTSVEDAWHTATDSYFVTTGMQSTWGTNASHNFWITGVQLEVGEASPFEHRSYGEELSFCQRYYENNYPQGSAVGTTFSNSTGSEGLSFRGSAGTAYSSITFKQVKRVAPTITIHNGVTGNTGSWRGSGSTDRATSGSGKTYSFMSNSGSSGDQLYRCAFFEADAEL